MCHVAVRLVQKFCCDDALEVFGNHGVGGIVGNLMTGVFAEKRLGAPDGGGLDGNWDQCVSTTYRNIKHAGNWIMSTEIIILCSGNSWRILLQGFVGALS